MLGRVKTLLPDQWESAVNETDGVRLVSDSLSEVQNPLTGETITIPGSDLDAEIFFPAENTWHPALFWHDGSVSINARFAFGDQSDPVWFVLSSLVKKLGAKLRGEEGEVYDAETGEIVSS